METTKEERVEQAKQFLGYLTRDERNPLGALRMMLGTTTVSLIPDGVRFDMKHAKHRIKLCVLKYDYGQDLFELRFHKYSEAGFVEVEAHTMLFVDQLTEVFERTTGLRVVPPTIQFYNRRGDLLGTWNRGEMTLAN